MSRKEEKIFLKLAGRRAVLRPGAANAAIEHARKSGNPSLVKALLATDGISIADANAIQDEVARLAFRCPRRFACRSYRVAGSF